MHQLHVGPGLGQLGERHRCAPVPSPGWLRAPPGSAPTGSGPGRGGAGGGREAPGRGCGEFSARSIRQSQPGVRRLREGMGAWGIAESFGLEKLLREHRVLPFTQLRRGHR